MLVVGTSTEVFAAPSQETTTASEGELAALIMSGLGEIGGGPVGFTSSVSSMVPTNGSTIAPLPFRGTAAAMYEIARSMMVSVIVFFWGWRWYWNSVGMIWG